MGDISSTMARYGTGELTVQQAAALVRPLLGPPPPRVTSMTQLDPDPAPEDRPGGDGGFGDVAYALHSGVITLDQYAALVPLLARK